MSHFTRPVFNEVIPLLLVFFIVPFVVAILVKLASAFRKLNLDNCLRAYHIILYHTLPYFTVPCHAMSCLTIPYHAIPNHAIPYYILYHTIPCHTKPCHTILYIIPYHTMS